MTMLCVGLLFSVLALVFADDTAPECTAITVQQPMASNYTGQTVYFDIVKQGHELRCRFRVKVAFAETVSHYTGQYDHGETEIWYSQKGPGTNVFSYYLDSGLQKLKKRIVVVYVDSSNPVDPDYFVAQTCGEDKLDWFSYRYEPLNQICDRRNSFNAAGGIISQVGDQFGGAKKLLKAIDSCILKHTNINCNC